MWLRSGKTSEGDALTAGIGRPPLRGKSGIMTSLSG